MKTISRSRLYRASTGAALLFLVGALVASAQPAPPGEVVAAGLAVPRGLAVDGEDVLIADLGTGQILRLAPDGSTSVAVSGLPTTVFFNAASDSDEPAGPSAVLPVSGGYAIAVSEADTGEFQSVYFADASGNLTVVADLGAYEAEHNTDGEMLPGGTPELLSNPYALLADGAGGLFVSDSGANAVLRVAADGTITPYATFPNRENPLFPGFGPPTMDQVPTGLALGPDGALYVSTLTGFPFPQGGAVVYRLSDDDLDGMVSAAEMSIYASGLTTATDLAFDSDGSLLVTQFSADMLGENVPGQLVRVSAGTVEVVIDGLITPTNLVVTEAGRILVSQAFAGLVSDVTDEVHGGAETPAVPTPDAPTAPDATPAAPAPGATGSGGGVGGDSLGRAAGILALAVVAFMGPLVSRRMTRRVG